MFGHEKVSFLHLPTPLDYLENVSRDLGINLYIKRDDMTSLGTGGNKLRKLEYILHAARQAGATALVTVGGPQTNHGRLTAAVAAKFGLKCTIVAVGAYPGELSANLLLDRIMGCTVYLVQPDGDASDAELEERAVRETMQGYEAQGDVPFFIPLGGSSEVGILGYAECAVETAGQAEMQGIKQPRLFAAVGSLGTYMGLFIGAKDIDAPMRITGIAITPSLGPDVQERAKRYFDRCREVLEIPWTAEKDEFDLINDYHLDDYNNPVKEVREALYYLARKEGIILDPCYTGKAFYGLLQMVEKGEVAPGENVIFLHSGGTAAINGPIHRIPMEEELMDGILIKKPAK